MIGRKSRALAKVRQDSSPNRRILFHQLGELAALLTFVGFVAPLIRVITTSVNCRILYLPPSPNIEDYYVLSYDCDHDSLRTDIIMLFDLMLFHIAQIQAR